MDHDSASAAVHCMGVGVRPLMAETPGAAKTPQPRCTTAVCPPLWQLCTTPRKGQHLLMSKCDQKGLLQHAGMEMDPADPADESGLAS